MHLTEDEIALFSAFVLMSAGKRTEKQGQWSKISAGEIFLQGT